MKLKNVLYLLLFPVLFLGLLSWFSGGSPGGKTGSPGDGANCTQCHSGTVQQITGWITTNIPSLGYTPGETYTITASGTHSGVVKFGFEATSENTSATKKGSFVITDAVQTKLTNNDNAVTHTSNGTAPTGDSKTWTFNWIAPDAGTGNITFFSAFNATNGNGNTQGDFVYLTNTEVIEKVEAETDLTINFSGMTPHIGQMLEIRLINKYDLSEFARKKIDAIPSAEFNVSFEDIIDGSSYFVEFYADHNDNGMYDIPPADHAWRLEADSVNGGHEINFNHNTNFFDIEWKHLLTFNLQDMDPHQGQLMEIRLRDITLTYEETFRTRIEVIPSANFSIEMPGLTPNHSYNLEFYADLNGNGVFDPLPTDHAWLIKTGTVNGDKSIDFTHNTNFEILNWTYQLTLDLNNMNPHLGQSINIRVTEQETGMEVSRFIRNIDLANIGIFLPKLSMGKEYYIDFYVDHNGNSIYDIPPTDHAWQLTTDEITGNTSLSFTHNTDFVDIDWRYVTTLHAQEMHPHIGQLFELRVYNELTFEELGMITVESLELAEYFVNIPGAEIGENYNIDFYADFNENGIYDSPPTDHAWRINIADLQGDTLSPFTHNTNFTDIMWPVSVDENEGPALQVLIYPNPFSAQFNFSVSDNDAKPKELKIYNIEGKLVKSTPMFNNNIVIEANTLRSGIYHIIVNFEDNTYKAITAIKK